VEVKSAGGGRELPACGEVKIMTALSGRDQK
jgi:hypothetical protein